MEIEYDLDDQSKIAKIRSKYIFEKIIKLIRPKTKFKLFKYNKKYQHILRMNLDSYKEYESVYSPIVLVVKPENNRSTKLINVDETDLNFVHIFINNENQEFKKTYIESDDMYYLLEYIDYRIHSFKRLFLNCYHLKEINFINFKRNNIFTMKQMFFNCSALENIEFTEFNTENVLNMSYMFYNCLSIKEIYLYNFNTFKVHDMSYMFYNCILTNYICLSPFKTNNVKFMNHMFYNCVKINTLDLNLFNTKEVTTME